MAAATPPSRRWNARRVLAELARGAALSRAELAGRTGLSAPTVGKLADGLLDAGLLEEADPAGAESPADATGASAARASGQHAVLGRPARPLRLERRTPRLVTLQLGVRHTRLAALPVAGPSSERWPVRFDTPRRAATWQRRLKQAAQCLPLHRPWAVVLSVPGVVDERTRRVLLSPNLHWTQDADLAGLVRDIWDAPVLLVQEIRALALGHLAEGRGDVVAREDAPTGGSHVDGRPDDFVLVDFGDGVGAAVVRDGQLYEGALPLSGELGHTPIGGNQRACGCGAIGCMETLTSRQGLLQSLAEAHGYKQTPSWRALSRHVQQHGVEPWLEAALDVAGRVMGGALNVLGIKHLVVTGALAELPPSVHEALRAAVQRSTMWARFGRVHVTLAPRRRAAGLVAAGIDRVLLPAEGESVLPMSA